MIKTQILLWKTIEGNSYRRLRIRVRVRFLLFYSKLTPTALWCNMLREFTWMEKDEEAMSDEHSLWELNIESFHIVVNFKVQNSPQPLPTTITANLQTFAKSFPSVQLIQTTEVPTNGMFNIFQCGHSTPLSCKAKHHLD